MQTKVAHQFKRVLVTGGAGFIGSNLLLRLVPRYPDVSFVNLDALTYAGNLMNLQAIEAAANYQFVQGDVADLDLVRSLFDEHQFTTVIHLAAESHVDRSILDPLAFVRSNTLGTAALLDAARHTWMDQPDAARRFRFYHISTDEVFGSLGETGFFDEVTPYDPRSPYSASKAASDHLVRAYFHTYGLPVVLSNCSNNYGPFQFPEKLIPVVILNAAEENPIPVYGTGANVRDWLHVRDHAAAIERILQTGINGETYCISGNCERTNLALVEQIADLVDEALERPMGTGRKLIQFVTDRPGHDYRYAIDASKLRDKLGWSPSHTLDAGLRETVAWYLSNTAWLDAVRDASYRTYYAQQYGERLT